uniref:Uncharacterized protein n=1 Tax=Myotis lucifugus TaxID=59463 RepID=G1QG40_MYOLU
AVFVTIYLYDSWVYKVSKPRSKALRLFLRRHQKAKNGDDNRTS